ncbi:MAG: hypothetical protein MSB08_01395 [Subdoligranulum sp.]|nr:hypothetical protein [Subdoligranulum sp.]
MARNRNAPTPKGRGAALRSIWPQANRDETQRHWPAPEVPRPQGPGALL